MSWWLLLCLGISLITILINLFLNIFWNASVDSKNDLKYLPNISILVAAKNEEQNLPRCLESLVSLDYPPESLEILIGDDQSNDKTGEVIKAFESQYPFIKSVKIDPEFHGLKAKANVLAQLAKQAKGSVYFITDADMQLPKTWVKGLLTGLHPKAGIVNGMTSVAGSPIENNDWLYALGMVRVITKIIQPVTAMGNNMLVTKEAYEAVGGYENLPFSITEDFELFKHTTRAGFSTVQLMDNKVLGFTQPTSSFNQLLNQRKRWMKGAVQLPAPIFLLLLFQALYFPALIVLILYEPVYGLMIFLIKSLLQSLFTFRVYNRLKLKVKWYTLCFYEFYSLFLSIITGLFYLVPMPITWKGRKY